MTFEINKNLFLHIRKHKKMTSNTDGEKRMFSLLFLAFFFLLSCNNESTTEVETTKDSMVGSIDHSPLISKDTAGKKTIYLTFDDGPNPGTRVVLNIAKEEQLPVTFFSIGIQFTGENKHYFGDLWQRMHEQDGVEICNHSFTHAYRNHYERYYATPAGVMQDFMQCADSGHFATKICRAPGNNIWLTPTITQYTYKRYKKAVDSAHANGFIFCGWDCEWFFRKMVLRQTAQEMYNEVDSMLTRNETHTPNHLMLLTHDQTFYDAVDSTKLRDFVKMLKANPNYRFDVCSHYPGMK
jgi:peptidoglycan-N-acetylglucosamine deacetylase